MTGPLNVAESTPSPSNRRRPRRPRRTKYENGNANANAEVDHMNGSSTSSDAFSSTGALPPPSPPPSVLDSVVATSTTYASSGSGGSGSSIIGGATPQPRGSRSSNPNFIGLTQQQQQQLEQDHQRATHTVRLSSLRHNYAIVEDAASRQRCSVIVVVKADGYGHGAVETAVHLADYCGADAFAVATLEEGIRLRMALRAPPGGAAAGAAGGGGAAGAAGAAAGIGPDATVGNGVGNAATAAANMAVNMNNMNGMGGGVEFGMMPASTTNAAAASISGPASRRSSGQQTPLPSLFRPPSPLAANSALLRSSSSESMSVTSNSTATQPPNAASKLPPRNRSPRIRIVVLGPPVGYPRSFDLYHHHNIELMVSGPEVARALMDWVGNAEERKRTEVERAAAEFMGEALTRHVGMMRVGLKGVGKGALEDDDEENEEEEKEVDAKSREEKEESSQSPGKDAMSQETTHSEVVTRSADINTDEKDAFVASDRERKDRPARVDDDEKKDDLHVPAGGSNGSGADAGSTSRSARPAPLPPRPVAAAAEKKPQQNPSSLSRKAIQLSENVGASATLSNVTGDDLAREVRAILLNQQAVKAHVQQQKEQVPQPLKKPAQQQAQPAPAQSMNGHSAVDDGSCSSNSPTLGTATEQSQLAPTSIAAANAVNMPGSSDAAIPTANAGARKGGSAPVPPATAPFRGIEEAAKLSRDRQLAAQARREAEEEARAAEKVAEDDGGDDVIVQPNAVGAAATAARPAAPSVAQGQLPPTQQRKRLRWHALVDSGMGRLGFKPDPPGKTDGNVLDTAVIKPRKPRYSETINLIKELHDLEVRDNAPLEFYGMCTHMADATSSSTFTHSQMERFLTLLDNVRAAGIPVPTVSTDNSSALLTTTLNHFDPARILSQQGADTRGFVRTGGAIYGQRPAFRQLRAISTLTASVRHVSVIKAGDSVGYDRAYTAPMDVRIATLTIGFADGYPRELGNGVGRVSIRGSSFKVAGNVCMDMLMVELGPAGDSGDGASVQVGDVATLWGPEGPDDGGDGLVSLASLASTLKTTQSALTCGLDKIRVERKYIV